jgi:diguanylate cyclase (GGDEF)-like protein
MGSERDDWEDYEEGTTAITYNPTDVVASGESTAHLIVLAGTNVGEMYAVSDDMTLGRGSEAEIRILGDAISRRHARIQRSGQEITISDLQSTNGTFVNGVKVTTAVLADGDKIQIGSTTILKFTYHDKLEEHFQRELYDSALRDGLTKAFNRRHFMERIEGEITFALRHTTDLALLMLDVDHFKKTNDTYGHVAGDHVLIVMSKAIRDTIRNEDIFARYGGEEFVILCRGTNEHQGIRFARRIHHIVRSTQFTFQNKRIPVTISVGVATLGQGGIDSPTALIQAADSRLYEAKRAGRDCVVPPGDRSRLSTLP